MHDIDIMSDTMFKIMLASIDRWGLLSSGENVVVAVSGGPDSTALLALMCDLAKEWNLTLTAAHLDHGINPELGEIAWLQTQELAKRLGVKWVGKREDVLQARGQEGSSIHQVARRLRYQFFISVASQVGAELVATGHTADDQAETVLMRIMRGSGVLGASGIPAKRAAESATIIRPLLAHRRSDLAAFCRERDLPYVDDPANVEVSFLRSRVRHEVLPVLEKAFGHDVVPHIVSFAERLREDQEVLSEKVALLMSNPGVKRTSTALTFPRGILENESPSVIKLLLVRALEYIRGRPPRLKAVHLESLVSTATQGAHDCTVGLPGGFEVHWGKSIVRIGAVLPLVAPMKPVVLKCPGETEVPALGVRVKVAKCHPPPGNFPSERGDEVYIRFGAIRGGLSIRTRRPGDSFLPLGAPGRRKLKKVLIDRKVSRPSRDKVPIITTGAGSNEEILWVVGVALSESCRASSSDKEVWYIEVEPLKGEGGQTVE